MDTRLPFGGKSAPSIFHRITQSIRRMMSRRGFHNVIVYLDDFLVVGCSYEECQKAYDVLCSLLLALGFQISPNKLVPPCQSLTFLGVQIDTVKLTLSLPAKKLDSLKVLLASFQIKRRATKRQLQQLAGKLNWACKVVFGGRTFLRRILDLMNTLPKQSSKCCLTSEFYSDIEWWVQFLDVFNGHRSFLDTRPVTDIHTDACSIALGAAFRGDWFYSNLLADHPDLAQMHINFKEAICVVLALERWAPVLRNKTVHIHCDNTAAVAMINKGTTANKVMMTYLRHLFWLSATFNFRLKVFHVPGALNVLADCISRLHMAEHLMTFCEFLGPVSPWSICAFDHMSPQSYFLLLGLFSSGASSSLTF